MVILVSCGYEKNLCQSLGNLILKSIEWFEDQACLAILEPLAKDFTFLMCSFFLVLKHLPVSPTCSSMGSQHKVMQITIQGRSLINTLFFWKRTISLLTLKYIFFSHFNIFFFYSLTYFCIYCSSSFSMFIHWRL